MALLDMFRVGAIRADNARLASELEAAKSETAAMQSVFNEIGGLDVLRAKAKVQECEKHETALRAEAADLERQLRAARIELEGKRREIVVLDEELLLESFALYKPKFHFTNSTEYRERLDIVREKQKALIKSGKAVTANESWTVNGSKTEGKKMVSDMKKLLLRSFNNECDYCVDSVKFNNIESYVGRIEKSYDAVEKLGRILSAAITLEYKQSKVDELHLAYEYQQKKQEEKEEQRRIKEEAREQQKLEAEIKAARDKIAKERKHFATAIKDLERKLADASESEKVEIEQRLAEVTAQCTALDNEEKVIDYREQNAKAGYVYIISNVGAFGEGVFKIGMTRRLEPRERVDELGDASVPFAFDIHALIFSENAPALEAKLHTHFERHRINKVNLRKEFFRAELAMIEAVLRENYDKVFDLTHVAPAEQYRESLAIQAA